MSKDGYRDYGKGRKVIDLNRRVLLTEELSEDTIAAIMAAEPGERSKKLNYLMSDGLSVACPKCHAAPGQPCTFRKNPYEGASHKSRLRAAYAKEQAEKGSEGL